MPHEDQKWPVHVERHRPAHVYRGQTERQRRRGGTLESVLVGPQDVADRFVSFLAAAGVEVVSLSCKGIVTAAEVGTLGRDEVLSFVQGGCACNPTSTAPSCFPEMPATGFLRANYRIDRREP